MNKIINVIRLGTSKDIKKSIKIIVDQLEKDNYAFVSNVKSVRLFSRFVNPYKDKIIISKVMNNKKVKNVISLRHDLKLIRVDDFSFKLKVK